MRSTPIFCWSSMNQAALRGLEPPHFPILTTSSLPVLVPHTPRGKPSCSSSCLPCPAFLHLLGFLSQTTSLGSSCTPVFTGQAPFAIVAAVTAPQPSHRPATPLGQPSLPTCSQVHLLCLSGRHALFLLPLCPCSVAGGTLTPSCTFPLGSMGTLSDFWGQCKTS